MATPIRSTGYPQTQTQPQNDVPDQTDAVLTTIATTTAIVITCWKPYWVMGCMAGAAAYSLYNRCTRRDANPTDAEAEPGVNDQSTFSLQAIAALRFGGELGTQACIAVGQAGYNAFQQLMNYYGAPDLRATRVHATRSESKASEGERKMPNSDSKVAST